MCVCKLYVGQVLTNKGTQSLFVKKYEKSNKQQLRKKILRSI